MVGEDASEVGGWNAYSSARERLARRGRGAFGLGGGWRSQRGSESAFDEASAAAPADVLTAAAEARLRSTTHRGLVQELAAEGNVFLLQRLVHLGLKATAGGEGAVEAAAGGGHLEMLEELEECGVRLKDGSGPAVVAAAGGGHLGVLRRLRQSGLEPAKGGAQALSAAASAGCVETLEWLRRHGLDPASVGHLHTPGIIVAAAGAGHVAALEWLQRCGVDPCREGLRGPSLKSAAAGGHVDVLRWLIGECGAGETPAPRRLTAGEARSAMEGAGEGGHVEALEWLVEHDCDPKAGGSRAIANAAGGGHIEALEWLDTRGGLGLGGAAIIRAAAGGHIPVLEWLCEHSLHPASGGAAAVASAASSGEPRVLEWLLLNGLPPMPCNADAVVRAAAGGHVSVLQWLVEHGVDLAFGGREAVVKAARGGHIQALEWLEDRGVGPRVAGGSAVVAAVEGGSSEALAWIGARGVRLRDSVHMAISKATEFGPGNGIIIALAQNFRLPLDEYPSVVEQHFWEIPEAARYPALAALSRTLLINLVTVPSPAAEAALLCATQHVPDFEITRASMASSMRAVALDAEPVIETLRSTIAQSSSAARALVAHGQGGVHQRPWRRLSKCCRSGGALAGRDVPVVLARVAIPGILGPEILQALASSTRKEVFATVAARAIVLAAWEKVKIWYYVDLVLEVAALAAICHLAVLLQHSAKWASDVDESAPAFRPGPLPVAFWVVMTMWVYNMLQAVAQMKAFLIDRREWRRDYLTLGNALDHFRNIIVGLLVAFTAAEEKAEVVAPLVALVGFDRWWKVLYSLRALDYFGERLLPIIGAFREVLPFTLVLVFYAGAFVHSFYSLSHQGFDRVLVSVYRLGVLGDFTLEGDIFGSTDRQQIDGAEIRTSAGPRLTWWRLQMGLFFGTTFLLTVAMMNIFIQVMGSAFDRQEEVSEARFVRSRAEICLHYFLRPWPRTRHSETDMVWTCYQDRLVEDAARSMRQSFARTCGGIQMQLDKHITEVDCRLAKLSGAHAERLAVVEEGIERLHLQMASLIDLLGGRPEQSLEGSIISGTSDIVGGSSDTT